MHYFLICIGLVSLGACRVESRQRSVVTASIPQNDATERSTAAPPSTDVVRTQELFETSVLTVTATITPTLTATGVISPTINPISLPSPVVIETWTAAPPAGKDESARRQRRIESESPT